MGVPRGVWSPGAVGTTVPGDHQQPPPVAVGLLAATLPVVAHTLAKSLLFSAGSGLDDATATNGRTPLVELRPPWMGDLHLGLCRCGRPAYAPTWSR